MESEGGMAVQAQRAAAAEHKIAGLEDRLAELQLSESGLRTSILRQEHACAALEATVASHADNCRELYEQVGTQTPRVYLRGQAGL